MTNVVDVNVRVVELLADIIDDVVSLADKRLAAPLSMLTDSSVVLR